MTKPPTTKQRIVLALLDEGLDPPAIAERMGIARSGAYLHVRNLRKKGLVSKNGQPKSPKVEPPETPKKKTSEASPKTSSNGSRANEAVISAEIADLIGQTKTAIADRLAAIGERRAALDAEDQVLAAEVAALTATAQRLTA